MNNYNQSEKEPLNDLDRWIQYKKGCAVDLVEAGYSVEWRPDGENWISAYVPGQKLDGIPEYRAWAKFYEEPSQYGIDDGKVSKLSIDRIVQPLEETSLRPSSLFHEIVLL